MPETQSSRKRPWKMSLTGSNYLRSYSRLDKAVGIIHHALMLDHDRIATVWHDSYEPGRYSNYWWKDGHLHNGDVHLMRAERPDFWDEDEA